MSNVVLLSKSGSSAALEGDEIVIRDREGTIIVRHDGATTTLSAPRELVLSAESVRIEGKQVAITSGVLELHAERVIERFTDVYREIEGAFHQRAGRLLSYVDGAMHMFAKRTNITSEEDTNIDGKRVMLG
ncbi:MAG: DUF3540 domain-containing protein [Polyangiales bacterium]